MTVLAIDGKDLVLKHGKEAVEIAYSRRQQLKPTKPKEEEKAIAPLVDRQPTQATAEMGKSTGIVKAASGNDEMPVRGMTQEMKQDAYM